MMDTNLKPVLIRKNTKKLREILYNLKFEKNPYVENWEDDNACLWVVPHENYIQYLSCPHHNRVACMSIDCGMDENMFLNYIIKYANLIK